MQNAFVARRPYAGVRALGITALGMWVLTGAAVALDRAVGVPRGPAAAVHARERKAGMRLHEVRLGATAIYLPPGFVLQPLPPALCAAGISCAAGTHWFRHNASGSHLSVDERTGLLVGEQVAPRFKAAFAAIKGQVAAAHGFDAPRYVSTFRSATVERDHLPNPWAKSHRPRPSTQRP